MKLRLYNYVGPDEIKQSVTGEPGKAIASPRDVADWARLAGHARSDWSSPTMVTIPSTTTTVRRATMGRDFPIRTIPTARR